MNMQRTYVTNLPADALAQALADHFAREDFETQVFASGGAIAMQARKQSLWRQALGMAYAMTVLITPQDGKLGVELGGHEWVDTAVSAGIGLVVVPPVLLGTAWGLWRQNQLDKDVWQVIEDRVEAAQPEAPATMT